MFYVASLCLKGNIGFAVFVGNNDKKSSNPSLFLAVILPSKHFNQYLLNVWE